MAFVDLAARKIAMTVVYYGPAGSGKTACIRHVYARTGGAQAAPPRDDHRRGYYDLLPLQLGEIRGFRTHFDLLSVPSGDAAAETRRALLEKVDGVVFVADGREERGAANAASLAELRVFLSTHGLDLALLPYVVQVNHADAPSAASPATTATPLIRWHPQPAAVPVLTTVATTGAGVFEALKAISRLCLAELKRSRNG
ncbi:MAG: gliding-motility protein MglA [Myxococcales bacterium]|nr:gliding-motility protein MglA [Myxococcales bacterium]